VVNHRGDGRVDLRDFSAGGDAVGASIHDASRLLRAFLDAAPIAAGADNVVNFEAFEVRAAGRAQIAEDFFGDGLNELLELLRVQQNTPGRRYGLR
jgi:hypothetical protein